MAALAQSPAPTSSGATAASASSSAPKPPPVLAVYGDGYSVGTALGGQGDANWAALVAKQVGATLDLEAVSRAGYTVAGSTGLTLPAIVGAHPVPTATVTVIFAGHNDLGSDPAALSQGIDATLQAVQAEDPSTALVVVGPAWSDTAVPSGLLAIRDAAKAAADSAHAAFVDPLADHWFTQSAALVASDGVSPTDAGHQFMARVMAPVVRQALEAASRD